MQTRTLPAIRGVTWLVDGFRLYKRNPPLLTFLTLAYLTLALLLSQIRFFGVLLPLLMPTLIALIANVCRTVDRVLPLPPTDGIQVFRRSIMNGLREQRRPLLRLGMLQLCGTLAVVMLVRQQGRRLEPGGWRRSAGYIAAGIEAVFDGLTDGSGVLVCPPADRVECHSTSEVAVLQLGRRLA